MILIALDVRAGKILLFAADTYIGAHTALEAKTVDEAILRFSPVLRNWVELQQTEGLRKATKRSKSHP